LFPFGIRNNFNKEIANSYKKLLPSAQMLAIGIINTDTQAAVLL
jgi:hypothetical protein